jgi:hypothetical protein
MTEQVLTKYFTKFFKMKKVTFIVIAFLFIVSCKKEFHFKNTDITVTDINGNITGNINTNDWKLNYFSDASSFDQKVFTDFQNIQQRLLDTAFSFSKFKNTCTLPTEFNFISYPNPMQSDCKLHHKLTTDFNFREAIVIITKKDGEIIQHSGFVQQNEWFTKVPTLVVRDFIYYAIFVTQDSCLYYTKGNVIGCTL